MGYELKTTKDELYRNGFHRNVLRSDKDTEYYTLRFPVCKYKQQTVLEGEITVEISSGDVQIDVFKVGTRDIYFPYYHDEYSKDNQVLVSVQKAIDKQIKKLDIKKKRSNKYSNKLKG